MHPTDQISTARIEVEVEQRRRQIEKKGKQRLVETMIIGKTKKIVKKYEESTETKRKAEP